MKTILLMVHDDAGQESRLQCALDVTRATEGHLLCLDVLRMPVVVDAYGIGVGQAAVIMDESDREDSHVARLDVRLAGEGISYEFARMRGEFDIAIAEGGRLVDLIVVSGQGVSDLKDQGDLPARLAQLTTAPILAVPPEQKGFDLGGKAIVAWDGSSPAASAIRAAVPMLTRAGEVEVLTITEKGSRADPEDVARYLGRHGCKVSARSVERDGAVGTQLLQLLSSSGAAWGVMGSYGHSRMREQIFGGTTRSLLTKSPIPLLISH
jgi:nucleotide-binding universal stress UspA family protein